MLSELKKNAGAFTWSNIKVRSQVANAKFQSVGVGFIKPHKFSKGFGPSRLVGKIGSTVSKWRTTGNTLNNLKDLLNHLFQSDPMATENHKQNTHPPIPEEDYLYRSFLRDLRLAKPPGPRPVGVALFGAGRAGTVHLASLARNPRVDLLYVVEDARSKWAPLRDHWNLRDARFLAGADAGPVYEDDR